MFSLAQDVDDTADEAEVLVSRSLLQAVDGGYCVHDMVLDYASVTVDRDDLEAAVSRQARYLSAVETLRGFAKEAKHTNGLRGLIMLWRAVEKLAGDPGIQGRSYGEMLRDMETGARESNHTARVVWASRTIARLFELQVSLRLRRDCSSGARCVPSPCRARGRRGGDRERAVVDEGTSMREQ